MSVLAKKKIEEEIKEKEFDILTELENVNEYLRQGFKEYIWDKGVKTKKEFEDYLKEYGG